MTILNDLVKDIIDAQKVDDWSAQHEAFCRLTEFVCQREIEQFNKGYEMAERHYARGIAGNSLTEQTMRIIEEHGGFRTPPICAM